MHCPKDKQVLKHEILHGVAIDRCQQCHGVWLDTDELRTLVSHFSADETNKFLQLKDRADLRKTPPGEFWSETEHSCPHDGTKLGRRYFGGNSGIGIEYCQQCSGFWFDGGELESIRKVVAPNPRLDAAIGGFANDYGEEVADDYQEKVIIWMDLFTYPERVAEEAVDFGLNVLKSYLIGRVLG